MSLNVLRTKYEVQGTDLSGTNNSVLKWLCFPDFKECPITRSQKHSCGYKYLIEDDNDHEAPARIVLLEGPADEARDPLKGYRRIELILSLVDNKFYIAGIKNGTRECVIKITDEQT